MNKRTALYLTAVLSMASAYAQNAPQSKSVPVTTASADTQLNNSPITIETGTYAGPLSSLLAAIAKTAGYGLILDSEVDSSETQATATSSNNAAPASTTTTSSAATTQSRPVVYSFKDKPFNQVWPLLMDVYGLSYEVINVGGQPVLRVGNAPIQRIVKLNNIDATQGALQVKLAFGTPVYTESPRQNEAGQTVGVTRTLIDVKLDSPTLRIVPDTRTNSLIIRGTNREVQSVVDAVAQVDSGTTTSTDEASRKVYQVQGDVASISDLLTKQYPLLRVVPVTQTKQLIISGDLRSLNSAIDLLSQVDKPVNTVVTQKIFQLVNASAEEVKATLEGALQKEITTGPTQAGTGTTLLDVNGNPISALVPPSQQASADAQGLKTSPQNSTTAITNPSAATIIADKRTNTLVVRGTQTQVDQVAELIPQLDKVVPQINVQIRIQELSDEAIRNLGLNGRVGFGNFNIITANGSDIQASFDPTQSLVGFNIFPTLTALEKQNMAKRVYDGNVTMQSGQRSIGSQSQTDNASSTASASVKSGGRLEINIPSTAANIPSIQKQIDYGVNLDFFNPQVAPDGSITLRVRGQVNTPGFTISPGMSTNILDFKNSEAQSVVTFKSGETLLLAGLMGQTITKNNSGLPYLSSLGIGGGAQSNKTFSQLLVIITGTVIK